MSFITRKVALIELSLPIEEFFEWWEIESGPDDTEPTQAHYDAWLKSQFEDVVYNCSDGPKIKLIEDN